MFISFDTIHERDRHRMSSIARQKYVVYVRKLVAWHLLTVDRTSVFDQRRSLTGELSLSCARPAADR